MRLLTILTFSAIVLALPARSATIRVRADQPTIQAGIDAAAAIGDTVLVAPGTYYESLWYGFQGKNLVLRSEAGAESTEIAAEDEGITFQDGEGPTAEIDGFTIRDGWLEHSVGAGIRIFNSSPTIKNCVVRDCTVISNDRNVSGGGMFISGGSPVILNCVFYRNRVSFIGQPPGHAAMGGGVCCAESSPNFINCTFADNEARAPVYSSGGGIMSLNSNLILQGCTFYGNWAIEGGGIASTGVATVENSIIAFSGNGEAVLCSGGQVHFSCSDVFGNAGGNWTPCIEDQLGVNGNISADPLFCDALGGDLKLRADSPCAPGNSPSGCGLIGALPVGCGVTDVADEAPSASLKLTVVPNPVRGAARFEAGPWAPFTALRIFDSQGRLVEQLTRHDGYWEWAPGDAVPAGVYFARPGVPHVESEAVKFLYLR
jgi:serine protease